MSAHESYRLGFLSSRLGRALDARPEWFQYLRAALRHCRDFRRTAVTAIGTAAEPFVTRGAALFGAHVLRLEPDVGSADAAITRECDALRVLSARPNGNVARLVEQWLADPACDPSAVWLADHPALIPDKLRQAWRARGATCWRVDGERAALVRREAVDTPGCESVELARLPTCDVLLHCTRRREGPWPGQTTDEYLDELILGSPSADRSPLASLRRILLERRIRASNVAIRGGHGVVSFTAESLENLHQLRAFRPHRHRWDFEPFGVAIRRDWLESRGARPVIYGDTNGWVRLDSGDRPFFQRRATRERSGGLAVDWMVEREWRLLGDVDLAVVPVDAAWIFVPDTAAAQQLSRLARWPVVLVRGAGGS